MMLLVRTIIIILLFGGLLFILTHCNKDLGKGTPAAFLNLHDTTQYVGMQTCRSCHPAIYNSYKKTGMGLSFDTASLAKTSAVFDQHSIIYDTLNNLYYRPFFKDSIFYVEEYRVEKKDTTHRRVEKIDYIVGSGQHTNSHILNFNGYVYQAPITYYTQEEEWDLAPGFRTTNFRFGRLLNSECISCHNHFPKLALGAHNKFTEMPKGIECERCHGPGEIHLKKKLAGEIIDTAQFIDYSIVNPRHLSKDLQLDLCQRCHLQGVAVLNEDKTFYDFKPGMALNEVMNVYLPRYSDSHEKFIMASQADRLRMSECFKNSEELTCLTCHNPHHSVALTGKEDFNNACLNCHQQYKNQCAVDQGLFDQEKGNCISCHMPKSGSIDIPHVNITDHNIGRMTARKQVDLQPELSPKSIPQFLGLESMTAETPDDLDMANGYLALYDKYMPSNVILDSVNIYLNRSKAGIGKKFKTQIHYYFNAEQYSRLINYVENNKTHLIEDAWTNYRIGQSYLYLKSAKIALSYFETAIETEGLNLEFLEKKGVAQMDLKLLDAAKRTFQFVIMENPKRKLALNNLGFCFLLEGDATTAERYYDKAIALDPDYEQALLNKAAVRILKEDQQQAIDFINRALKINPENQQALGVLQQLEGSQS